jgi:hypothetical protein
MSAYIENRTFLKAIKVVLPVQRTEWIPYAVSNECCEPLMVCGSNDDESWKKDTTSAWIKLFSSSDSATIFLYKNGVLANTQPTPILFPKDNGFSLYGSVDWTDVMNVDGIGCYVIKIEYTIGGVSDVLVWGGYQLWEFSSKIVDQTFRIKSIFNSYHDIEDINFTSANVVDTIRLSGYFGDMQPNTVFDNIIYPDKTMKRVKRENIRKYFLFTNPLKYVYINLLINLHLLSEDEIYLSDFNGVNPSLYYLDYPLIVSESAELEYSEGSKKVSLKCTFTDKVENNKTHY